MDDRTVIEVMPKLADEWHMIKNGDRTPENVLACSSKKVWWHLVYEDANTGNRFDFEWQESPRNRIMYGYGCPFLSNQAVWRGFNDLATTHPELANQWDRDNNELMPEEVTYGRNIMVYWIYPYDDPFTGKHHDFRWKSLLAARLSAKNDCPFLAGKRIWPGFNDLKTLRPDVVLQWNYKKNKGLSPSLLGVNSKIKVWWETELKSPITGETIKAEWKSSILARTNAKYDNPFLVGKKVWAGYNDLSSTHPEIAKEWHPSKNGALKPNEISKGYDKKVWWYLPYDDPKTGNHFEFEWCDTPSHRVGGRGCPYLTGRAVWKGFNDLETCFPEIAAEWNTTKNGSLTPSDITSGSQKRVWWCLEYIDNKSNEIFYFEWRESVSNRTSHGYGCPFLSNQSVWAGFNDLSTTNPEILDIWDEQKNRRTPIEYCSGSDKKVWWKCKTCGKNWRARIANVANGKSLCSCIPRKKQ